MQSFPQAQRQAHTKVEGDLPGAIRRSVSDGFETVRCSSLCIIYPRQAFFQASCSHFDSELQERNEDHEWILREKMHHLMDSTFVI